MPFLDSLTGVLLKQAKWKDWKIHEKMLPFISWWWWFTGYGSEQCKPHQQDLFICSLLSLPITTGWNLHLCLFEDTWANKLETTTFVKKLESLCLYGMLGATGVIIFRFNLFHDYWIIIPSSWQNKLVFLWSYHDKNTCVVITCSQQVEGKFCQPFTVTDFLGWIYSIMIYQPINCFLT